MINPNVFGASNLDGRVREYVSRVLSERQLFRHRSDGVPSWNSKFERLLADWTGCGAVALSSGTAALRVALRVAGVSAGDRVLVSAYTFVASAMAVTSLGAIPEPVDVTTALGIDVTDLRRRLNSDVRAVIGVHVRGQMADLSAVAQFLGARGIPLIEDACQAMGASCDGRPAGSVGDLGVLSFQQNKQLASGEGGAIVSRRPELVTACARYADLGAIRDDTGLPDWDDERAMLGENCRMTEVQAAILCAQMEDLRAVLAQQRDLRDQLRAVITERGVVIATSADPSGDSASHILILARDHDHARLMRESMAADKVVGGIIWDRPYYCFQAFRRAGLAPEQLGVLAAPTAERLAPRLVAVPISPGLKLTQVEELGTAITTAYFHPASVAGIGEGR